MLTFKPWKIESVLQMLLGLFGGITFAGVVAHLAGYRPVSGQVDQSILLINMIGFQGVGLLWLHWLVRDHETDWATILGLRSPLLSLCLLFGVLTGVVGYLICIPLSQVVGQLLSRFSVAVEPQSTVLVLQSTLSPAVVMTLGFGAVVLAPIMEEFIFRGLLYPVIKQLGYPRFALWGTAVLFGCSHVNLQAFVPLTLLALLFTYLYEKTDHLLAPILAHATFNAINFVMAVRSGALAGSGPTP